MFRKHHNRRLTLLFCSVLWLVATQAWSSAQMPRLVIQLGHTVGDLDSIAVSPTTDYLLLSTDRNGEVILWNAKSGAEIRRYAAEPDAGLWDGSFSPDGHQILALSWDTIYVWDTLTGKQRWRHKLAAGKSFRNPVFSSTQKLLVRVDDDVPKELEFDIRTGRSREVKYDGSPRAVDPLKRQLLLIGEHVKLISTVTGKAIQEFPGNWEHINSLAISHDGRFILTDNFLDASQGGKAKDQAAHLFSVATGREVLRLVGHGADINGVALSPDSKFAFTGSEDGTVRVWDLSTGQQIRSVDCQSPVISVTLSKDGNRAFVATADSIHVWSDLLNSQSGLLTGTVKPLEYGRASAVGPLLKLFALDNTAQTWDISHGQISSNLNVDSVLTEDSEIGPITAELARGVEAIQFTNAFTGEQVGRIPTNGSGRLSLLLLSKDAHRAFVHDKTGEKLVLWDVVAGTPIREFAGHRENTNSAALSSDERLLLTGSNDSTARLWDTSTGKTLQVYPHNFAINLVGFSCDATKIFLSGERTESIVRILETQTKKEIAKLDLTFERSSNLVTACAFSCDGVHFVTGNEDGVVRIWNITSKTVEKQFLAHQNRVTSVSFLSPDRLLTTSWDGTAAIWQMNSVQPICRLVFTKDGGWIVADGSGRFDTNSLESSAGLRWAFPDEPFRPLPLEIFMRQYYEPHLLSRLLSPRSDLERIPPLASLNRVQPEVKIQKPRPVDDSGETVIVAVDVTSTRGPQMRKGRRVILDSGAYDFRLFRDGQLVAYRNGKIPLDGKRHATIPCEVKLPRRADLKEVVFTAYAFNSDRVKSVTDSFTYTPEKPLRNVKGRAYVISVGVNAYEESSWDLNYAARDAAVSEEMLTENLEAVGDYQVVPVKLISDYERTAPGHSVTEKWATKLNFKTVLEVLAHGRDSVDRQLLEAIPGGREIRKAQAEDLVIISFSSHGYTDNKRKFYLVPYDTGSEIKSEKGEIQAASLARFISSDELSEWVRDIDAGELVLIVDTCHSAGAVAEPGFKPGPMGSRGMGQLAYDKGMRILAASQANDVALEIDKLQQGLLTYALMQEGLAKKQADRNRDGRITLTEWLSYGVDRVPSLYADVRAGRLQSLQSKDLHLTAIANGDSLKKNAFQQPQLFDFKRSKSKFVDLIR